jgi:hypothetical protein
MRALATRQICMNASATIRQNDDPASTGCLIAGMSLVRLFPVGMDFVCTSACLQGRLRVNLLGLLVASTTTDHVGRLTRAKHF